MYSTTPTRGRLVSAALLFATFALTIGRSSPPESAPAAPPVPDLASFIRQLDNDGDGMIERFEAADRMLELLEDGPSGGRSVTEVLKLCAAAAGEVAKEAQELHDEFDRNDDGKVELSEIPRRFRSFAKNGDVNGDGVLTLDELRHVRPNLGEMVASEARDTFAQLDRDRNGSLSKKELPDDMAKEVAEADRNSDGLIDLAELTLFFQEENAAAHFVIEKDRAFMRGVINGSTPARVLQLIVEHPNVRTIVMPDVPGSMDDESNLRAAELVHRHGFTTIVPKDGVIASGGVDFFLAGTKRRVESGGKLGVHSWDGSSVSGSELPKDHEGHAMFLEFYPKIGISNDFYWFTLEAAPADGIHWMTVEEMKRFSVTTTKPAR